MDLEPISAEPPALRGRETASQLWRDLAFLHWRVDPPAVAPLLPPGCVPDVFDGTSWVGLIGFRLEEATLFSSPPVPFAGSFVEINVRLYAVDALGRRGVVFRSLEASRLLAVFGARAAFSIPYYWASTGMRRRGDAFAYRSMRHGVAQPRSAFAIENTRTPVVADPLADFLTARWALFARRRGRTVRLPNTHDRWSLYEARVTEVQDDLVSAAGIPDLTDRPPDSVLYSPGADARFGRPEHLE